nr:uncharacterized mitochondrial protein AtMg00810-like [Tanacetum cinerariifolium]
MNYGVWTPSAKHPEYGRGLDVVGCKGNCWRRRSTVTEAPRAWYDTLSQFLLDNKFSKGAVDPTLFTRKTGKHILLVQIYVDDIIFASTDLKACNIFSNEMSSKFQMSMMGQMLFFLGLQVSQNPRGIFINQSKFDLEILKKFGMDSCDPVDTVSLEKSNKNNDWLEKLHHFFPEKEDESQDTVGFEFGQNQKNRYFGLSVDTGKFHGIPHSYHNKENLV